jgi:hypothetical protein
MTIILYQHFLYILSMCTKSFPQTESMEQKQPYSEGHGMVEPPSGRDAEDNYCILRLIHMYNT